MNHPRYKRSGSGLHAAHQSGYVSTQVVAETLGVSTKTVRAWIAEGKLIPDHVTDGGHARFTHSTVQHLSTVTNAATRSAA